VIRYSEYDVLGNVVKSTISTTAQARLSRHRPMTRRPPRGRTNELGYVTTYSYATNSSGGRVVTTTNPAGSTVVESHFHDGNSSPAPAPPSPLLLRLRHRGRHASDDGIPWLRYQRHGMDEKLQGSAGADREDGSAGYTNIVEFNQFGQQIKASDGSRHP